MFERSWVRSIVLKDEDNKPDAVVLWILLLKIQY